MMKGHKRTKKLVVAVAATAILTLGMTSAYLADASENITNYFDPEWVKVDMQESGDQQYDIIPGTEEEKDPKVKVNNSVDAYVYLVVTDNVNAGRENNPLVTYSLDSNWTEISKADLEGKTIYDSEGNEITLGDNDKLYYQVAPKTATGEGDEDKDDYEITYPVLVGDKVSYSTDITNEDLENLEKDGVQNILKFVAYAIQKDPFTDPVYALCHDTSLADARAAAKQAIADAAGENPSEAVQASVEAAMEAIDAATTPEAVQAAQEAGERAIEEAKAAAQLAAAKAAAKEALLETLNSYGPEGDNEHGNDAQNAAYADAIADVEAATTLDAVDNAKTAGITAIENAATPTNPCAELNKKLKEQGLNIEIAELAGYKQWKDAMAYAAEKGGRLATVAELQAIYNIEKDMSPRPIYSEMTGYQCAWSSEEYGTTGKSARVVVFTGGGANYNTKDYKFFVVVVRDLA